MTQAKLEPGNTNISLMGRESRTAGANRSKSDLGKARSSRDSNGKQPAGQKSERVASPLDSGVNLGK